MDLELLKRVSAAVTAEFGNNCEVVVHDLGTADAAHTIASIENGHVSHRHTGDGASRVVLEALQRRSDPTLCDELGYLTRTADGRILKSSTVYLRDDDGIVEGVLSINYDITELLMAERAVGSLINHRTESRAPERIPQSVSELLDDLIGQSMALSGKPVALMTKADKIEAIDFLNRAGAFLITHSGDKVARHFGISKFTLYSYIDAGKNDKQTEGEPD